MRLRSVQAYVVGTCHGVSREWLQSYMDEYCWRYAHRHDRSSVESLVKAVSGYRRTVRKLIELFSLQQVPEAA